MTRNELIEDLNSNIEIHKSIIGFTLYTLKAFKF